MSIRPHIDSTLPTFQQAAAASGDSATLDSGTFLGANGGSFKTLLDIINPLQQLPVVSTAYRALTGDTISPAARLAGGALYGGPLGFAGALLDTMSAGITGKDMGETVVAQLTGGDDETQVADNSASQYNYTPAALRAASNAYVQTQSLLA